MEWTDEALILSTRPHGETAAIAELFTRARGRCVVLVHGGRSRKLRPVLQAGNHVDATWSARLEDQLGHASVELRRGFAAEFMNDPAALAGLMSLAAICHLLPEREPHPSLFEVAHFVLGYLDDADIWPALMVRFELALLGELGFGLDLTSCAATGATEALEWVSPRSGRAVSHMAGLPYRDRLLALPKFLIGSGGAASKEDIAAGFALTGHFLRARVYAPAGQELPAARARMIELVARRAA